MRSALRYPVAGEDPPRTLAIGVLLSALGGFVFPAVFVAGYYGRVLAASSNGERRPPAFDEWGSLLVQGFVTWLVVAMYVGFGVLVFLAVGALALVLGALDTGAGSIVGILTWVVAGLVLLGALLVPAWFFLPVVLARVARTGSVAAAFEIREIASIAVDGGYLRSWVAGLGVLLVDSVAYGVLGGLGGVASTLLVGSIGSAVPTLGGHVVGAAVNFYCQVVAFHLFGRGYGAAVGGLDDTASADEETTDYRGWGAEARAWRERRREERREPEQVGR